MENTNEKTFESFLCDIKTNYKAPVVCKTACVRPVDNTPVVICGPSGCGKTHLLLAMQNFINKLNECNKSNKKVCYITCEKLVNDMVKSIDETGDCKIFYDKYLAYDVLLIDDCRYIEGKFTTQERLLYLFDRFYFNGKLVAIATDNTNINCESFINKMQKYYRNVAFVKVVMPGTNFKIAYLKWICQKMSIYISDDIIEYIAKHDANDNIPCLQGYMKKLKYVLDNDNKCEINCNWINDNLFS